MAGILVYALHDDEGNFNKNSLGAISEAAKLAAELGGEAAAVVVGEIAGDRPVRRLATTAPPRSTGPRACPRASPSRSSTRWPR